MVHPSLSNSHQTASSSAAASAVKKLEYLPAGRESLSTSCPPPKSPPPSLYTFIRRFIREQLEVGRSHLLQEDLSPLDIRGFSLNGLGVVEVKSLSPWGQSGAIILLTILTLQGLMVKDVSPQSLADCSPPLLPGTLGDPRFHQVSPDVSRVQGLPSFVLGQGCPLRSLPQCLQPPLSEDHLCRRTLHYSKDRSSCSSLHSFQSLSCRPRWPGVRCWGNILQDTSLGGRVYGLH